jgi:3-deoxy-D-manno-octulosonate 8-phosphate phosphatase KdsC-like HAD superfamily phosphatase
VTTTDTTENPPVFRRFALPVATFDYLKEVQRTYAKEHGGAYLNNNEVLEMILKEHQQITKVKMTSGEQKHEPDTGKAEARI